MVLAPNGHCSIQPSHPALFLDQSRTFHGCHEPCIRGNLLGGIHFHLARLAGVRNALGGVKSCATGSSSTYQCNFIGPGNLRPGQLVGPLCDSSTLCDSPKKDAILYCLCPVYDCCMAHSYNIYFIFLSILVNIWIFNGRLPGITANTTTSTTMYVLLPLYHTVTTTTTRLIKPPSIRHDPSFRQVLRNDIVVVEK